MKYLYHHLGLGDHIICNGMVREYYKKYNDLTLFVKKHNLISVSFMFRDLFDLQYHSVNSDNEVIEFMLRLNSQNFISHICPYAIENEKTMDETFYKHANMPYSNRWDSFKIIRDNDREKMLFNYLNLKEQKYIFVHDDNARNFNINLNLISSDLPIIKPNKKLTDNIFDYCYIIENANEIHCMDSCFRILIEHLNTDRLFYHSYARYSVETASVGWGIPNSKKEWIVL